VTGNVAETGGRVLFPFADAGRIGHGPDGLTKFGLIKLFKFCSIDPGACNLLQCRGAPGVNKWGSDVICAPELSMPLPAAVRSTSAADVGSRERQTALVGHKPELTNHQRMSLVLHVPQKECCRISQV